jgi:hypothetical protein
MTTKAKTRTLTILGCGILGFAVVHLAGGNPGAMPADFVLFEEICETICGVFLLYHAKKLRENQALNDSGRAGSTTADDQSSRYSDS